MPNIIHFVFALVPWKNSYSEVALYLVFMISFIIRLYLYIPFSVNNIYTIIVILIDGVSQL